MLVSCPNCLQTVDPQARYCEHCGADLALSAVLAEQAMKLEEALPDGLPLTPEILVPRLGDYLLEKGILQPSELERALTYQEERIQAGKPLLLGQALRDLG